MSACRVLINTCSIRTNYPSFTFIPGISSLFFIEFFSLHRAEWKLRKGSAIPSVSDILIGMGFAPNHVDLAVQCHGEDIEACIQFILSLQASSQSNSDSFFPAESKSSDSLRSSYDSVLLCVSDEELPSLTELDSVKKDCASDSEGNDRVKRCYGGDLSQIDIYEEIRMSNANGNTNGNTHTNGNTNSNSNGSASSNLNGSLDPEEHFMNYLWTYAFRYDFWSKQSIRILSPLFLPF